MYADSLPSFASSLSNLTENYNGIAVFHCYVHSSVDPVIQVQCVLHVYNEVDVIQVDMQYMHLYG